jgi:hypothetical protein
MCHIHAMDLTPYVTNLRGELVVAAEAGGEDARALAERITAPLDSAVLLTLIEALSAAADEITTDLAPGSVEMRLRGRDANFLVTPPPAPIPATLPMAEANVDGAVTRLNVRLPEALKARIEEAAAKEQISANVWLVRAAAAVLDSASIHTGQPNRTGGRQFTGWVR